MTSDRAHGLIFIKHRGRNRIWTKTVAKRLRGTTITTNIRSGGEEQTDIFGLIDTSGIKRMNGGDGRMLWCEIVLSDWVFNAIEANEVLTLHRDYFRLRKPLERRVYELARKHCGQQPSWKVSLELLLKKSGSQSSKRLFRSMMKNISKHDHLPDYHVNYDAETDQVAFINRNTMPLAKSEKWNGRLKPGIFDSLQGLDLNIDKYVLEQEFRAWVRREGIEPKNPEGLFLKFAKTWKENQT